MLLRRVIEHVRAQNWTAVVLDFFIVVIGVFVGLQVSNWNETRLVRAEEKIYLQRLHEDVSASIEANLEEMADRTRQAEQATLVLESLKACSVRPADRDVFAQGLFTLGKFGSTQFVRTAFEELKSTGKFDVISNAELRKRLFALVRDLDEQNEATKAVQARMEPHILYTETHVGFNITAPISGNSKFSFDDLDFDLGQLCADRRFALAVSAVRNYTFTWIAWDGALIDQLAAIRKILEGELGLAPTNEEPA